MNECQDMGAILYSVKIILKDRFPFLDDHDKEYCVSVFVFFVGGSQREKKMEETISEKVMERRSFYHTFTTKSVTLFSAPTH